MSLAACAVGLAALIAARVGRRVLGGAGSEAAAAAPPSSAQRVQALEYTAYDGADVAFSFRAERMVRRGKKIGALTLNLLEEIDLVGLEIRGRQGIEDLSALPEMVRQSLAGNDLGRVVRVTIHGLRVVRLGDAGPLFTIEAERARLDLKRRTPVFDGRFVLSTADGHRIVARRVTWDRSAKRFRARGPFVHDERNVVDPGVAIGFTLDGEGRLIVDGG